VTDEGNGTRFELVALARVSVGPGSRYELPDGPFGSRIIAGIAEGRWEGERLAGNIVGAGGDWAVAGDGDAMLLDVRQVIETDDGAVVYVSYNGRCDVTRGTFTVAPTFETGDERYAWLNVVQAIGQGRFVDGRLEYQMFEVR
jgi:Protein of unknown function (DUF3237)